MVKQQDYLEFMGEKIDKNIWDGKNIKNALDSYDQHPELFQDQAYREQSEFLFDELDGIRESASEIYYKSKNISTNYSELSGIVSQSVMNMGSGSIGIKAFYPRIKENHPLLSINFVDPEENPQRKSDVLIEKLGQIDSTLPEKLSEIRKSEHIVTKIKHLKSVAHNIRDFMSEFLQSCDPKNQVKNKVWVKYSRDKNPTQPSRVKFAIVGNNPFFSSEEQVDKVFGQIAIKYRKLYGKLSKLAHFRGKYLTAQKVSELEIGSSQMLEYTEIIIDLRSIHFQS